MAISETITINNRQFTARKLTVRDIRNIEEILSPAPLLPAGKPGEVAPLACPAQYVPNVIDAMFIDGLPSVVLFTSLQVGLDDLDDLLPEQVKELMEAVANINPIYAESLTRLSAIAKTLSSSSTAPVPS